MSTSFSGALKFPPKTYIRLQKLTALVLLVAVGYLGNRGDGISHWVIDEGVCEYR